MEEQQYISVFWQDKYTVAQAIADTFISLNFAKLIIVVLVIWCAVTFAWQAYGEELVSRYRSADFNDRPLSFGPSYKWLIPSVLGFILLIISVAVMSGSYSNTYSAGSTFDFKSAVVSTLESRNVYVENAVVPAPNEGSRDGIVSTSSRNFGGRPCTIYNLEPSESVHESKEYKIAVFCDEKPLNIK